MEVQPPENNNNNSIRNKNYWEIWLHKVVAFFFFCRPIYIQNGTQQTIGLFSWNSAAKADEGFKNSKKTICKWFQLKPNESIMIYLNQLAEYNTIEVYILDMDFETLVRVYEYWTPLDIWHLKVTLNRNIFGTIPHAIKVIEQYESFEMIKKHANNTFWVEEEELKSSLEKNCKIEYYVNDYIC